MSTTVDKQLAVGTPRTRTPADETRRRVLHIARQAFCDAGYDHVGLRHIAARASTDAAIVVRLFGSKEALFARVAEDAFHVPLAFKVPREDIGACIAGFLVNHGKSAMSPREFDAFQFLLRSATHPVAAPILATALNGCFVEALARHLGGPEAVGRAALITSCVLGVTTMRFAMGSAALQPPALLGLLKPLSLAIQACVDG